MSKNYAVDIPNCYKLEGEWTNVEWFETRKDAIQFVQKTFGGDEEGCVCLVRKVETLDDNLFYVDEDVCYADDDLNDIRILQQEKELEDQIKSTFYVDDETVLDEGE